LTPAPANCRVYITGNAQKTRLYLIIITIITIIIIIIITTTIFIVLSSWQSHCESSLGSRDEYRNGARWLPSADLWTKPIKSNY